MQFKLEKPGSGSTSTVTNTSIPIIMSYPPSVPPLDPAKHPMILEIMARQRAERAASKETDGVASKEQNSVVSKELDGVVAKEPDAVASKEPDGVPTKE
ncbi:hypothetical protein BDR04DRAFT_1111026 [Suillus decipiens]|nr:hypothetical protein BDR04DRAFT_1111026 [Suillus decipiens]